MSNPRAELGATTAADIVDQASDIASSGRGYHVAGAFDALAEANLEDRSEAWT